MCAPAVDVYYLVFFIFYYLGILREKNCMNSLVCLSEPPNEECGVEMPA